MLHSTFQVGHQQIPKDAARCLAICATTNKNLQNCQTASHSISDYTTPYVSRDWRSRGRYRHQKFSTFSSQQTTFPYNTPLLIQTLSPVTIGALLKFGRAERCGYHCFRFSTYQVAKSAPFDEGGSKFPTRRDVVCYFLSIGYLQFN